MNRSSLALVRPYRISSIEPLKLTDRNARRSAAEAAGLNVSLLDPAAVGVDLRTDSAASSRVASQLAYQQDSSLSPDDPRAHAALVEEIRSLTGKRHVALFAQGRAAEAALVDGLPLERTLAAGIALFPSTRHHLERRGCRLVECVRESVLDPASDDPFKGDPDLERALTVLAKEERAGSMWLELASNGAFGQPVSLDCLQRVRDMAQDLGIKIYLDATRCLENAVLLRRRENKASGLTVKEIVRESMRGTHAVTASCLKSFHAEVGGFVATDDEDLASALEDASIARGDGMAGAAREVLRQGIALASSDGFALDRAKQAALLHELLSEAGLPVFRPEAAHAVFLDARRFLPELPREGSPAKALALALYLQSGIRVDEHFLPEALRRKGLSVVRIAIPARRYFDDQIRWVAEELETLHARRADVSGLEPLPTAPGLASSLRVRFRLATQGVHT